MWKEFKSQLNWRYKAVEQFLFDRNIATAEQLIEMNLGNLNYQERKEFSRCQRDLNLPAMFAAGFQWDSERLWALPEID